MFNSTNTGNNNSDFSGDNDTVSDTPVTIDTNVRFSLGVIFILVTTFTVVANIIMIVALVRSLIQDKRRNNNSSNYNAGISKLLMASMAVSDAMLGAFIMPLDIYDIITDKRHLLDHTLNVVSFFFDSFLSGVSVYHVVFMAIERYLAICKPFVHRKLTMRTGYLMIGLSWTLPPSVSAVSVFTPIEHIRSGLGDTCTQRINGGLTLVFNKYIGIISTAISFDIPFVFMLAIYCRILWKVWKFQKGRTLKLKQIKLNQQHRKGNTECYVKNTRCRREQNKETLSAIAEPESKSIQVTSFTVSESQAETTPSSTLCSCDCRQQPRNLETQTDVCAITSTMAPTSANSQSTTTRPTTGGVNLKAFKTIGSIIICFTICWLPFMIFIFYTLYYCTVPHVSLVLVVQWLSLINSTVNPVLYCKSASIRRAVLDLFSRRV